MGNEQVRILHLLTSGGVGGIEVLCRDIGLYSHYQHTFAFLFGEGIIYYDMLDKKLDAVSLASGRKLSLPRFRALFQLAKECNVIIVHHNDPFLELYYLGLKRLLPRKKYISMVHHCYDLQEEKEQYGPLKRGCKYAIVSAMFRRSDKLLFVSKAGLASYTGEFRFDREKAVVVYNGINKEKLLEGKCEKHVSDDCVRLLYAGRLERIKGVSLLLDAMKTLKAYKWSLVLLGDGSERQHLEEQTDRLALNGRVRFEGVQKDVGPWMRNADVFIYPSIMEIFGLSLVEAMAFQCICIGNAVGGIPEIIQDGFNGFLNTAGSAEGLAQCIRKAMELCLEPEKRTEMMRNARATAERFTIDHTIESLENEVDNLVRSKA